MQRVTERKQAVSSLHTWQFSCATQPVALTPCVGWSSLYAISDVLFFITCR